MLGQARGFKQAATSFPNETKLRCFVPTPCFFPLAKPILCHMFTASLTKALPSTSSVIPLKHHLLLLLPLFVVWNKGGREVGHAISVGCGQSYRLSKPQPCGNGLAQATQSRIGGAGLRSWRTPKMGDQMRRPHGRKKHGCRSVRGYGLQ